MQTNDYLLIICAYRDKLHIKSQREKFMREITKKTERANIINRTSFESNNSKCPIRFAKKINNTN